jgi:phosphotriesterase-related protein
MTRKSDGAVNTVLGPVQPNALGVTLMHEHLFCDNYPKWNEPDAHSPARRRHLADAEFSLELLDEIRREPLDTLKDNLTLADPDVATREAMEFKIHGGGTIVDLSNVGLGRDPIGLVRVSRSTGLHVIAGCGYYVKLSHPLEVSKDSESLLARNIVRDIVEGIEGTSVKAGIIGEIGISYAPHPDEKKVLRASCAAQKKTGVPISLHCSRLSRADYLELLDIVEGEGCDPSRLVFGHLDRTVDGKIDVSVHKTIGKRGAYVQYDGFGSESYFSVHGAMFQNPQDYSRVEALLELKRAGLLSRILLSHDVYLKHHLRAYGGWGYAHILKTVIPMFKRHGFTDADLSQILVQNPAAVLSAKSVS